jgi:2-keto-4-pentenoate hydratase
VDHGRVQPPQDTHAVARSILGARARGATLDADDIRIPSESAYDVQEALTAVRIAAGERVVGWKLGYTSPAMREALGVREPNAGPLTDAMVFESPAMLPGGLLQPRVEPELAVILDEEGTIAEVRPALEVVDSVWAGYRFDWAHNTADGSSAAAAVLSSRSVMPRWIADATVVLTNSVGDRASQRIADQVPDLVGVVDWLRALLAARGQQLAGGSVVLTGGLVAPIGLPPGGWAQACFSTGDGEDIVVTANRPPDPTPRA